MKGSAAFLVSNCTDMNHEYRTILAVLITLSVVARVVTVRQMGGMGFRPRRLDNRSILAYVFLPLIQKTFNFKIKHRESFRPFAPSVLCSDVID